MWISQILSQVSIVNSTMMNEVLPLSLCSTLASEIKNLKKVLYSLMLISTNEQMLHWKWSPGWLQIDLAMTHQDVNLCAFVWLSRGSVTDGKCMIHADVPGWCSGRQRAMLLLGVLKHQRVSVAKWHIYSHRSTCAQTHTPQTDNNIVNR